MGGELSCDQYTRRTRLRLCSNRSKLPAGGFSAKHEVLHDKASSPSTDSRSLQTKVSSDMERASDDGAQSSGCARDRVGRDVVGWDTEPGKDGTIRATTPSVILTKAKTNKQK